MNRDSFRLQLKHLGPFAACLQDMVDFDNVFKLATPKYVYIRDGNLGLLKYIFMVLIFVYVVVYEILYSCSHLTRHSAVGYGAIKMQHPVSSTCIEGAPDCINKYKNVADLKYCSQSASSSMKKGNPHGTAESILAGSTPVAWSGDTPVIGDQSDVQEDGSSGAKGRLLQNITQNTSRIGDLITEPTACRYLDEDRLTLEQTPNEIFVPMRYVSHEQELTGDCYDPKVAGVKGSQARKHSKQYFDCPQAWVTQSTNEFFVASIEDFTLKIQHSFFVSETGLTGSSSQHRGFFAACPTNHPKDLKSDCLRMEVPNTTGATAPEDEVGLSDQAALGVSSLNGSDCGVDVISFEDLLKLTPFAQSLSLTEDIADRKLPPEFGPEATSIRQSGGMMILSVSYDNSAKGRPGLPGLNIPSLLLGAIKPVTYTYRPYFVPFQDNKRVEVKQSDISYNRRTVNVWYGVTVRMSFEGNVVDFTFSELMRGLTTGLVLISSATTAVIYLALYLAPYRQKYALQMYQYTEDISNYRDLQKSGRNTDVDYFTGQKILDARKEGRDLYSEEITDLLEDYEIRLNRLDGKDPKLTFIDDGKKNVDIVRRHNNENRKVFYAKYGVAAERAAE